MRISWRSIYGGLLVALVAGSLFAAATDIQALFQNIVSRVPPLFLYSFPMLLGLIASFTVLEHVFPAAGPRKPLKGYVLNLKLSFVDLVAAIFFGSIVGACVTVIGKRLDLGWIDLRFSTGDGITDVVLSFLLSTFVFDFFFYWGHRFQHESMMWHQHKVHHLDEELCAVSTSRHNWLEKLAIGPLVTIPMAILFKMNAVQGGITGAMFVGWVAFIHSNIRLHLGPLGILLNGPQGHRVHHSRLPEHHDKNYAAFFPVFDVLFGTYHYPRKNEFPPTGVHDEEEVEGFWAATTMPLRAWSKMFRDWRTKRSQGESSGTVTAIEVNVEAGKSYLWCACGRSRKQPFCDGSHRGTQIVPLQYKATETGTKWFCVCKQTKTPPFCDCSHNAPGGT